MYGYSSAPVGHPPRLPAVSPFWRSPRSCPSAATPAPRLRSCCSAARSCPSGTASRATSPRPTRSPPRARTQTTSSPHYHYPTWGIFCLPVLSLTAPPTITTAAMGQELRRSGGSPGALLSMCARRCGRWRMAWPCTSTVPSGSDLAHVREGEG